VGKIAQEHEADVLLLVEELLPLALAYLDTHQQPAGAVQTPAGTDSTSSTGVACPTMSDATGPALASQVCADLLNYSLQLGGVVPSAEMARQEFEWRNGFFLSQAKTPLHMEWLRRAGWTPAD
jgi:hypothetical protein